MAEIKYIKEIVIYPDSVPSEWDNIEIEAMKQIDDEGTVERTDDEVNADFWSVFLHDVNGGVQCVADMPTFEQAIILRNFLYKSVSQYQDNGFMNS